MKENNLFGSHIPKLTSGSLLDQLNGCNAPNQEIRALSWKEPFGSLMLPPFNKIETRTWETKYRGLVLICLSKSAYTMDVVNHNISGREQSARISNAYGYNMKFPNLGKAIAIGTLVNCRKMLPTDEDATFVSYKEGWEEEKVNKKGKRFVKKNLYCHVYENVLPIKPFDWVGRQRWAKVPKDYLSLIQIL